MKLIVVGILSLVSSVAMADGFRCQGDGFRVKMFNQVQPELGTRNPAVLVVSEDGVGTIATLGASEISKSIDATTVTYEGKTNGKIDGRFVSVKLQIAKQPKKYGVFTGLHAARLTVNAEHQSLESDLYCERYLKGAQE